MSSVRIFSVASNSVSHSTNDDSIHGECPVRQTLRDASSVLGSHVISPASLASFADKNLRRREVK